MKKGFLYTFRERYGHYIAVCVMLLLASVTYMLVAQAVVQAATPRTSRNLLSLFVQPTPTLTLTPTATPTSTPTSTPTATPTPVILPAGISIPSIGIQAAGMEYVGVSEDGSMGTPHYAPNAGWLQIGPKPGESGAAIITGHYDDQGGNPAVFYNLKTLQKGADVIVHMVDGSTRTFKVDFVGEVDAYGNNIDAITRQTDHPSLTLVTCHGTWDANNRIYSKRLIVYAY